MQIPSASPLHQTAAPDSPEAKRVADIRKAADGFEEMFLVFMLRAGRSGGVGDAVGGSEAVNSTRDMLDAQLARSGAQSSHLGIAEAVVRQFTQPHRRG